MSTQEKLVVENFLKDQSRSKSGKSIKQVPREVRNAVNDLEKSLTKDDPLLADNVYNRDFEKNLKNFRQEKIFKENVNVGNVETVEKYKNLEDASADNLPNENIETTENFESSKIKNPIPSLRKNIQAYNNNSQSHVDIEIEKPKTKRRRRKKPQIVESQSEIEGISPNISANTIENTNVAKQSAAPDLLPPSPGFVDDGNIMGVEIHQSDHLRTDAIFLTHPVVSVGIVDMVTGNLLRKSDPARRVTSYYENDNLTEILPLMTQPFDFKLNKSLIPRWNELLVFNEPYNRFLGVSAQCKPILFFVIKDFVAMAKVNNKRSSKNDIGWYNIAWAFLKITDGSGNINTKRKIRLQLFYPPKNKLFDNRQYPVYDWWLNYPRQKYPATLYVTVKAIITPTGNNPSLRSMFVSQPEKGLHSLDDLQHHVQDGTLEKPDDQQLWSRFPGQNCKIPNVAKHHFWAGNGGAFRISFSHRGTLLAVACKHDSSFPIVLYSIPNGNSEGILAGHQQLIYDMNWSNNDKFLLSASGDGTVQIWNVSFKDKPVYTLPHPTYVYTSSFHPIVQEIIVTGGYDSVLRVWDIKSQKTKLLWELEGHNALINSLVFEKSGSNMYSVDSAGLVICWQTPVSIKTFKKESIVWTIQSKILDPSMTGVFINSVCLHPNNNKILLQCRDSTIKMLDTRIHTLKSYTGASTQRQLIRLSVTPCGNFVFCGSEDGKVYVWNAHTQDQVAVYTNLGITGAVHDVCYHPHDHMVAFCSFGDYLTVLLYAFDKDVASLEAGFKKQNLPKDEKPPPEKRIGGSYKFDRVLRTLDEVTLDKSALGPNSTDQLPPIQRAPLLSTWGSTFDSTMNSTASKFTSIENSPYKKLNLSDHKPNVSLTIDDSGNKSVLVDARAVENTRVLVLFDYEANRSDELNITRGDILHVLFKDSDNWWFGKKASDGVQGYFPSSYVQIQESGEQESAVLFGSIPVAQEKKVHALSMPDGRLQFYSQSESDGEGLSGTKSARQQRRDGKLQSRTRSILKKPKIIVQKPSNEDIESEVLPKEIKFEESSFIENIKSISNADEPNDIMDTSTRISSSTNSTNKKKTATTTIPSIVHRETSSRKKEAKTPKMVKQKQQSRPLPPLSSTHAEPQSIEKFKFLKSVQSKLDKDLFDETVIEGHTIDGHVADISRNKHILLEDNMN